MPSAQRKRPPKKTEAEEVVVAAEELFEEGAGLNAAEGEEEAVEE